MTWLNAWGNFYVVLGSASAALTGLMFVVTALIVDFRGTEQQLEAFGTPTVVHFGAALLASLVLSVPWQTMLALRVTVGLFSLAGAVYVVVVARRARRQGDYTPVLEDWMFHAALPMGAYVSMAMAAALLPQWPVQLMYILAAAAVLLLFIGLHNAWDTVTYVLIQRWEKSKRDAAG